MLFLAAFLAATAPMARLALRSQYAKAAYFKGPITVGVSQTAVWFHGGTLRAESAWEGLRVWERREGWLKLSCSGMPPVYLKEEELRQAGVLDDVLASARRHAMEFDSPPAKVTTST
jgi:hypothetical protein